MALNASGPISLAGSTTGESIALELGLSATDAISLNDTVVRTLAGISSGAIVMPTDFYGKSDTIVGPLYFFGYNSYNNAGFGTGSQSISTITQAAGGNGSARSDWVDMTMSGTQGKPPTLAVDDSGRLWSWGTNNKGSLGINDSGVSSSTSPLQIGSATNWESVSNGDWDNQGRPSCGAVKTNGDGYVWGDSGFGQLGNAVDNRQSSSSPVFLRTGNINQTYDQKVSNISKIFCCGRNTGAITTGGVMYVAGRNDQGAGGFSYQYPDQSGFETVSGGFTNWKKFSQATTSNYNGYFLRESGELYAAGNSVYGQNARPNTPPYFVSSPYYIGNGYKDVTGIASGGMAIKTNGTLWAWGRNINGNCGTNSTISHSSPTQVGSLTNWDRFAKGLTNEHQSVCLKTDNTIWGGGRMNDNDANLSGYKSSPVQILNDRGANDGSRQPHIYSSFGSQGTMILIDE